MTTNDNQEKYSKENDIISRENVINQRNKRVARKNTVYVDSIKQFVYQ